MNRSRLVLLLYLALPAALLAEPLPEAIKHYRAGYELMKAQNVRNAVDELEQATLIDSTYGDAFYALGQAYNVLNDFPKAIKAFEQAGRLGTFAERIPGELAKLYQKSGLKLFQQRKYPDAIAAFEKSLSFAPDNADIHFVIGQCQDRLRNLEAARKAYEKALKITPRNAKAQAALGDLYRRNREYSSATRAYEQAIAVDSTYMDAYGGLALVQTETEDLEGAVATLRRALQLDSKYPNGYLYLGAALSQLGRWHEAIEPLRQAVALAPKNPVAHYRLAEAYYGKGDYRLAIEAGQQALAHRQDFPAVEVVLADTYAKLGQVAQARTYYNRAIKDSRFKDYCTRQLEELARPSKPE